MDKPDYSIVIPVYNEAAGLPMLFERLYPVLDRLAAPYEVIFVDDGSRDRSSSILREQFERRPDVTRIVMLATNFGQHMAIMAGFQYCRGDTIVTLDADLQNPPEEIPALVAKVAEGYDYVGSIRRLRRDNFFRRSASAMLNKLREKTTNIRITDQGCMLRAYSRPIIDAINSCREVHTFLPALAYLFARRPIEIEVAHNERVVGQSKYSLTSLARLNFDLMTGFSIRPLQIFSALGLIVSILSMLVYAASLVHHALYATSVWGVISALWDRDVLEFFLIGMVLFGLGLLGEYVGRIYEQVRGRPRYLISEVVQASAPSTERAAADAAVSSMGQFVQ